MASECPGLWWWRAALSKHSWGPGVFHQCEVGSCNCWKSWMGFYVPHYSHNNSLQLHCICAYCDPCWNGFPSFDHLDILYPSFETWLKHLLHGWGFPPPPLIWVKSPLLEFPLIPYGVWPPHWLFYNLLMTCVLPHSNCNPRLWALQGNSLWFLWLVQGDTQHCLLIELVMEARVSLELWLGIIDLHHLWLLLVGPPQYLKFSLCWISPCMLLKSCLVDPQGDTSLFWCCFSLVSDSVGFPPWYALN